MAAMFITPPEQNHTRSANADWMELQALRAVDRRATFGDIIGIFDINEDAAGDRVSDDRHEESILDAGRNHPIDQLFDELQYRARVLGDAYPFTVETNPPALARVPKFTSTPGRVVYLFCLLASAATPGGDFFPACFHPRTLQQLLFLRSRLDWERTRVDRFIAAVVLGCLHGESHKTRNCLSNRMPRTISTKPDYSVRWWAEKGYTAPERDVFAVARRMARYRLRHPRAPLRGAVRRRDARRAAGGFRRLRGAVALMVTSPPYLDTTHHAEDQWLRLWFLGGPERPTSRTAGDDRHTNLGAYWRFLAEAWAGCAALLRNDAVIVVRIGGTRVDKDELLAGLRQSLADGLAGFEVRTLHAGATTAIRNRQTNVFRPGTTRNRYEHDFAFCLP